MNINEDFDEIIDYARMWDWAPEWLLAKEIYSRFPNSYSILTPFAYSYLEQFIRATTHEYGDWPFDKEGNPKRYTVGYNLVRLAIEENADKPDYVELLEQAKQYFNNGDIRLKGERRNNVSHGIVHPDKWTKENFEELIHYLATISKFSQF